MARLRPVSAAVASAALVFLVAACSSGAADASPVATDRVDLPPSYRFAPAAISVPSGTTVTWTNSDHFTHSVQFLDGGLPTEPLDLRPGASTTFTFATPGTYRYQCSFHPQNMRGTVVVGPA